MPKIMTTKFIFKEIICESFSLIFSFSSDKLLDNFGTEMTILHKLSNDDIDYLKSYFNPTSLCVVYESETKKSDSFIL